MMNPRVQIIVIVGTLLVALMLLNLVRKRKLREEYSLLWLASIIFIAVLAFDRQIVDALSRLLGVAYAPSALFIIAFVVGFFAVLHFSVAISKLMEMNKRLTQEVALMRLRLEESLDVNHSEQTQPNGDTHLLHQSSVEGDTQC